MTVPPEFHDLAAAARAGLREMSHAAEQLGGRSLTARSEDGAVVATVSLHGRMTELTLRPDATRTYDSETLGEVIAATIRAGQAEAAQAYGTEVRQATPDAVDRYLALLRDACTR